jgi:hypothetical protein
VTISGVSTSRIPGTNNVSVVWTTNIPSDSHIDWGDAPLKYDHSAASATFVT